MAQRLAGTTYTDAATAQKDLEHCAQSATEQYSGEADAARLAFAVTCMLARRSKPAPEPQRAPTTYEDATGTGIDAARITTSPKDRKWECPQGKPAERTHVAVQPEPIGAPGKEELLLWADAEVSAKNDGGCQVTVLRKITTTGTAVRGEDLAGVLDATVEICEGTCRTASETTLGELAQMPGKLWIRSGAQSGGDRGVEVWNTPGEPVSFRDLAHLYCAPQSTRISAGRPFRNRTPGPEAMCPKAPPAGHEARSLTTRQTIAVVLSHGPGWQGHENPNAWYENLVQAGPGTIDALRDGLGENFDVAIFESRKRAGDAGSARAFRRIAHVRLDGDGRTRREAMRGIGSALTRWDEEGESRRRWNELEAAVEGIEREDAGSGVLAAAVVITAAPGDGESCRPPDLAVAFVVAWSEAWGPVTCAPTARWSTHPDEWIDAIVEAIRAGNAAR